MLQPAPPYAVHRVPDFTQQTSNTKFLVPKNKPIPRPPPNRDPNHNRPLYIAIILWYENMHIYVQNLNIFVNIDVASLRQNLSSQKEILNITSNCASHLVLVPWYIYVIFTYIYAAKTSLKSSSLHTL